MHFQDLASPSSDFLLELLAKAPVLIGQCIVVAKDSDLHLLAGIIRDVEVNIDIALWGSAML